LSKIFAGALLALGSLTYATDETEGNWGCTAVCDDDAGLCWDLTTLQREGKNWKEDDLEWNYCTTVDGTNFAVYTGEDNTWTLNVSTPGEASTVSQELVLTPTGDIAQVGVTFTQEGSSVC
jgi:hypothetical protein